MSFKFYLGFLGCFIAVLSSCDNFFEREIELTDDDFVSQISIYGFISDHEPAVEISVAKNNPIFGSQPEEHELFLDDAEVVIEYNDMHVSVPHTQEHRNFFNYAIGVSELDTSFYDSEMTVKISHPDFPMVEKKLTWPERFTEDQITHEIINGGSDSIGVAIHFVDDKLKRNYYKIKSYYRIQQIGTFQTGSFNLEIPGVIVNDDPLDPQSKINVNDVYYLTDELISGKSVDIMVFPKVGGGTDLDYRVELSQITKDEYLYSLSQKRADIEFIEEPRILYSNIGNALGVICIERTYHVYF